jgi:tight adherence protein G
MKLLEKQKGVAALFYVLLVPPLFGLYALGTDGAIMIQEKARMDDAVEAATLAVTALNDPNSKPSDWDDSVDFMGSEANLSLARNYIEQYMHTAEDIDYLKVDKLECEAIPACLATINSEEGGQRYYQYHVVATTKHNSLYPNLTSTTSAEYNVGSSGVGEKYQGLPVDVVLVTDYSGSMNEVWQNQQKYLMVEDIIEDVTDELEKVNEYSSAQDSKVAITGFNNFVRVENDTSDETLCFRDMLYMDYEVDYYTTVNGVENIPVYKRNSHGVIERSLNYENTITKAWLLRGDNDGQRGHIPSEEKDCLVTDWLKSGGSNYSWDKYRFMSTDFYDVKLTKNFSSFNTKVDSFTAEGYTASHQGVIRGARLAQKGGNPKKLIIVLSDGKDVGYNYWLGSSPNHRTISEKLYEDYGMCDLIRTYLDQKTVSVDMGGENPIDMKVESKIFVIGFDYDLDANLGLSTCAGEDNVYEAQNKNEILSKILELISEEIGHLR